MGEPRESGAPLDVIAASLRRERSRARMSLAELARRAGVAKSTLSQLESGTGNPSVETLWALSVTLNVPFSHLVERPRPKVQVIRAGEAPAFSADQANFSVAPLTAGPPTIRRDIYLVTAEPGQPRESEPHLPGSVEHVVISVGRALVGLAEKPVELGPGDYVAYPDDAPHVFDALEAGTVAILVADHS